MAHDKQRSPHLAAKYAGRHVTNPVPNDWRPDAAQGTFGAERDAVAAEARDRAEYERKRQREREAKAKK